MVCSFLKKKKKQETGSSGKPKVDEADEQHLKATKKQEKENPARPNTGPERYIHRSLNPHQKLSQWTGGCEGVIVKEGKQGEKLEVCQIKQEAENYF